MKFKLKKGQRLVNVVSTKGKIKCDVCHHKTKVRLDYRLVHPTLELQGPLNLFNSDLSNKGWRFSPMRGAYICSCCQGKGYMGDGK